MNTQDSFSRDARFLVLETAALIAQSPLTSEGFVCVVVPCKAARPDTLSPVFLPAEAKMQSGKLSSVSIRHPSGLHAQHRAELA